MISVLFYPEPLLINTRKSRIGRLITEVPGFTHHNDPSKPYDIHIFWSYTRHSIIPDDITLKSPNVINGGCWDISKTKVNDIFNDISVDPTTHNGMCVEKYDRQGMHGFHKLIQCPSNPKTDYIYQRYIENKEGDAYIRYRTSYAGGITYIRKIYQTHPFETKIIKDEIVPTRNVFSEEEELIFNEKCKRFGFDLGDVDILMENGKPIIIDINNVVGGASVLDLSGYHKIDIEILKYLYKKANKEHKHIDFFLK